MSVEDVRSLTPKQFRDWIGRVVAESLFTARNRMVVLLAENADRAALEEEFREFFEEYLGIAFELEAPEASLLALLEACDDDAAFLKHRVKVVEAKRQTSQEARIAKRMGLGVLGEPPPPIKVTGLADAEFRALLEILANWPIFALGTQIVKLLKTAPDTVNPSQFSLQEAARFPDASAENCLRYAFLEFFVSYLEMEQFLEDYDYDADDGLEVRPELLEEIDNDIAAIEAGTAELISLAELAKEFGVELKCTR